MKTKFQKDILDFVWITNFGLNFVEIGNSKAHYRLGSNFVKRQGCNSWKLKSYGSWNLKTQCNKKKKQIKRFTKFFECILIVALSSHGYIVHIDGKCHRVIDWNF
jgi:hypothetical protein